jgi:hypothetical protein
MAICIMQVFSIATNLDARNHSPEVFSELLFLRANVVHYKESLAIDSITGDHVAGVKTATTCATDSESPDKVRVPCIFQIIKDSEKPIGSVIAPWATSVVVPRVGADSTTTVNHSESSSSSESEDDECDRVSSSSSSSDDPAEGNVHV